MNYSWQDIPGFGQLEPMARGIPEPTSRAAIFDRPELLRLALGQSRAGFAAMWGISPQAYDHYRTGEQGLTVAQAQKLQQKTGVSLDFLFSGLWVALPAELKTQLQEAEAKRDEEPEAPAPKRRRPRR